MKETLKDVIEHVVKRYGFKERRKDFEYRRFVDANKELGIMPVRT